MRNAMEKSTAHQTQASTTSGHDKDSSIKFEFAKALDLRSMSGG